MGTVILVIRVANSSVSFIVEIEETATDLTKIKPISLNTSQQVDEILTVTGSPGEVKGQIATKSRPLSPLTAPHKPATQKSLEDHSTGKRKDVLESRQNAKETEGL